MRTYIYKNKRNANKYIDVRRYSDGHYAWKQFIWVPGCKRNYVGCSLKRAHVGTWSRVTKGTLLAVLEDYELVCPLW